MKFISVLRLFILYFTLSFISCSKPPCECDFTPVNFIKMKVIDQQGQNLLVGPAALYQVDSLQILNQLFNLDINNASVEKGVTDSTAVLINFYVYETKNYIYYNSQTPEDSIEIKWVRKTGKCCNTPMNYEVVDTVKFNNTLVNPLKGIYYFVK